MCIPGRGGLPPKQIIATSTKIKFAFYCGAKEGVGGWVAPSQGKPSVGLSALALCSGTISHVHCALCTVHCALALCTVHSSLYTVHCALCSVYCSMCTVPTKSHSSGRKEGNPANISSFCDHHYSGYDDGAYQDVISLWHRLCS